MVMYYLIFVKPDEPFIPNFDTALAPIGSNNNNVITVPPVRPWTRRYIFDNWIGEDGKVYTPGDNVTITKGTSFKLFPQFLKTRKPTSGLTQRDVERITNHVVSGAVLTQEEEEKYDLNNDGVVNGLDLVLVQQDIANAPAELLKLSYYPTQADVDKVNAYVIGSGTLTPEEIAKYDINGDGVVDIYDLVYLSQKIDDEPEFDHKFSLYAINTSNNCQVTCKISGSGNYLITGENVIDAAEVLLTVTPRNDEYVFDGWYNFGLTEKIPTDAVIEGDQRIQAKCVKPHTLSYRAGDHIAELYGKSFRSVTGFSATVSPYRLFCRTACFNNWSGDDGNTYAPGDTVTLNADVVLTAQWLDLSFVPTLSDVVRMNKLISAGNATQEEIAKYDINGDGEVDIFDLVYAAQYVADFTDGDIDLILNIEHGTATGIKLLEGENLADILRIGVVVTPDKLYRFDGWYYDAGFTRPVGANDLVVKQSATITTGGKTTEIIAPLTLYGKTTKVGHLYNVVFDFGDTFCQYPEHAFDDVHTDTAEFTIPDVWLWSRKRVFSGWAADSTTELDQTDVNKIEAYLGGTTTLTQAEFSKYDLDGNGKITISDQVLAAQAVDSRKLVPGETIRLKEGTTTFRAVWGKIFTFYPTASDVEYARLHTGRISSSSAYLDVNGDRVISDADIELLEHKTQQNPTSGFGLTVVVGNGSGYLRDNVIVAGENLGDVLDVLPVLSLNPGYSFVGWYKDSGLTTKVTSDDVVSGNTTVWARTINTARYLKFNMNGVHVPNPDGFEDIMVTTAKTTIPNYRPWARGHAFRYWVADDGTICNPGDEITLRKDVTLTAVWYDMTIHAKPDDVVRAKNIASGSSPEVTAGTAHLDINGNGIIDKEDVTMMSEYVSDYSALHDNGDEYTLTASVSHGSVTVSCGIDNNENVLDVLRVAVKTTIDSGRVFDGWYWDSEFETPVKNTDLVDNMRITNGTLTVFGKAKVPGFYSISRYFGDIFRKIREFLVIAKCEDPEFEDKTLVMYDIKKEMFWTTAEDWGLTDMENVLNIRNRAETVEDRRYAIRARIGQDTPYSPLGIVKNLERIAGEGTITMEFNNKLKHAQILVGLNALNHIDDINEALYRMMPAHIFWEVKPMYNTHQKLHDLGKTHDMLDDFTHTEVREHHFDE